jgi:hypothetical protein
MNDLGLAELFLGVMFATGTTVWFHVFAIAKILYKIKIYPTEFMGAFKMQKNFTRLE